MEAFNKKKRRNEIEYKCCLVKTPRLYQKPESKYTALARYAPNRKTWKVKMKRLERDTSRGRKQNKAGTAILKYEKIESKAKSIH